MTYSFSISTSWHGFGLLCLALTTAMPAVADTPIDTGKIVVANRTSGTLSVIDVATDVVVKTVSVAIPRSRPPEPMYVQHVPALHEVFVSDRTNRYVAVYDDETFNLKNTAPLGNGAFHMWADPQGKQLWSVNDIDKTLSVIHPKTLKVVATVSLPKDLIKAGGKPHDIALTPDGSTALVTLTGFSDRGYVLRYDTKNRKVTHRAIVGVDPHVGISYTKDLVYVACQGSNALHVLKISDLSPLRDPISVNGTHGTGMKHNDQVFYTTNLPGGGKDGLVGVDVDNNTVLSKTDTGGEDVPHNITITGNDSKLYITHSGHGEGEIKGEVTVYDVRDDAHPSFLKKIPVGLNPFGIAYVP